MMHTPHQSTAHLPGVSDDPKASALYFPYSSQPHNTRPLSASAVYCPRVDVWSPSAALSDAAAALPFSLPFSSTPCTHSPSPASAVTTTSDDNRDKTRVQTVPHPAPANPHPHSHQPRQAHRRRKYKPVTWSAMEHSRRAPLLMNRQLPHRPPSQALKRTSSPATSLPTSWAMAVVKGRAVHSAQQQPHRHPSTAPVLANRRLIPCHERAQRAFPSLTAATTGNAAAVQSNVAQSISAPMGRAVTPGSVPVPANQPACCVAPPLALPSLVQSNISSKSPSSAFPVETKWAATGKCAQQAQLWSSVVKRGADHSNGANAPKNVFSSSSKSSKSPSTSPFAKEFHTPTQLKRPSFASVVSSPTSTSNHTSPSTPPPMPRSTMPRKTYMQLRSVPHPSPPSPPPLKITPPALEATARPRIVIGRNGIDYADSSGRKSSTSIDSGSGTGSSLASDLCNGQLDHAFNTLSRQASPVSPAAKGEAWDVRSDEDNVKVSEEGDFSSEQHIIGDEQHGGHKRAGESAGDVVVAIEEALGVGEGSGRPQLGTDDKGAGMRTDFKTSEWEKVRGRKNARSNGRS